MAQESALGQLSQMLARLPELKAEYERMGRVIAALEDMAASEGIVVPNTPRTNGTTPEPRPEHQRVTPGEIRPDEFFNMSAPDATRAYLVRVGKGNPQSPKEIAMALSRGGMTGGSDAIYMRVSSALKRLKKAGEVVQVRRNSWGLALWYGMVPPKKSPITRSKGSDENGGEFGDEGSDVKEASG